MEKAKFPFFMVAVLSLVLWASRILPHQPNFTPVLALCLFTGFFAKGRLFGLFLPLLALLVSDWMIGFYPGWAFNYVAMTLILFSGSFMGPRFSSFMGFGFAAACQFFILSNLGVWMFSQMYAPSFEGLLHCYEMGLPFFRSTLSGTLFFMVVFYFATKGLAKVSRQEWAKRV